MPDIDVSASLCPPRYSSRRFPRYAFIPGQAPHPRRHPEGHSFGLHEPRPPAFAENDWSASEDYLYAIDLYNFSYWWESHEVFEGLWHANGPGTQAGNFFQALIQLAGANLKHRLGRELAVRNLGQRGIARLQNVPPRYMGIDILRLADDFKRWLNSPHDSHVKIRLDFNMGRERLSRGDASKDCVQQTRYGN